MTRMGFFCGLRACFSPLVGPRGVNCAPSRDMPLHIGCFKLATLMFSKEETTVVLLMNARDGDGRREKVILFFVWLGDFPR